MKTIYIASPYTKGDIAMNVRAQIDAVDALMDAGLAPMAPLYSHFQHMIHPRHYEDWMAVDLVWVAKCDALVRLPGESSGADREVALAQSLGIPVFFGLKAALNAVADGTL